MKERGLPQHEQEVRNAIRKERGHDWVVLGPAMGGGEKGKWCCMICGKEKDPPLGQELHNEICPKRSKA